MFLGSTICAGYSGKFSWHSKGTENAKERQNQSSEEKRKKKSYKEHPFLINMDMFTTLRPKIFIGYFCMAMTREGGVLYDLCKPSSIKHNPLPKKWLVIIGK